MTNQPKEMKMKTVIETAAWKWQQAPIRTAWGDDMVVASVAIDKDHTVDLYCELDQTLKVEEMFASHRLMLATPSKQRGGVT